MFENLSLLSHDEKKKLIRTLGEIFLLANLNKSLDLFVDDFIKACPALMV